MAADPARVVLVHDWLTGMRGGEKCLEVLCRQWPDVRLYTLLHARGRVSDDIERLRPRASFLQRLPHAERYYRYLLPLMPFAANWRIPPCDVVVSFSHCVAKAAVPPRGVPHVCYCFTPMRYAWHMREAYFEGQRFGKLKARVLDGLLSRLRDWDRATAGRVSHFIAISRTVRDRIAECYNRDSQVIYPPVDTDYYTPADVSREGYYLAVSAMAPYKRLDLAIEACNKLGRPLVVIGSGQDERRLRSLAGPTVKLLGWQPDGVIRSHLRSCKALLFPGEEDFGIVPLEAHACGTPVIAYGKGGVSETTLPLGGPAEPTAVWFGEQSAEGMLDAILRFEKAEGAFDGRAARRQAVKFHPRRFERELLAALDAARRPAAEPVRRAA